MYLFGILSENIHTYIKQTKNQTKLQNLMRFLFKVKNSLKY